MSSVGMQYLRVHCQICLTAFGQIGDEYIIISTEKNARRVLAYLHIRFYGIGSTTQLPTSLHV